MCDSDELELVDSKGASGFLKKPPHTLANWRSLGIGPPYYVIGTRDIRYSMADLRAFVEAGRVETKGTK